MARLWMEMPVTLFGSAKLLLATLLIALLVHGASGGAVYAEPSPLKLAFLGTRFLNDNEKLEPTTDAERHRLAALEPQFTSSIESSRKYEIISLTEDVRAKIATSQPLGQCGGCEATFGKELHADRVAWMTVQKVSNLILNMNLYVADPKTDKLTFLKSVDIRSNTDESWSRSLKYLLDNYFLAKTQPTNG
jgi:hypothetical protein